MEKNLPSHRIDHYNLSSAQRRPGLLAWGGGTALPVDQSRGTSGVRLAAGCTAQSQIIPPDRRGGSDPGS